MTKNFHKEIKLAMKAGMYQDLSIREKAIYKMSDYTMLIWQPMWMDMVT